MTLFERDIILRYHYAWREDIRHTFNWLTLVVAGRRYVIGIGCWIILGGYVAEHCQYANGFIVQWASRQPLFVLA